jgi:hypothetical protein
MSLGLAGEMFRFITGEEYVFIAAMSVMGVALIAGMISLWPNADFKESHPNV